MRQLKAISTFREELRHLRIRDAGLTAMLVVQALAVFVAAPLIGAGLVSHHLLDLTRGIFVLTCVVALTGRRDLQWATVLAVLVASAAPQLWARIIGPWLGFADARPRQIIPLAVFGLNLITTFFLARLVFERGKVTAARIQGAVVIYLNVAVLFTTLYDVLEKHSRGALRLTTGELIPMDVGPRFAELLYFSLSTITTCGFGDFTPVHPVARSLANLEAGFGQLFLAIFLARLVAMHLAEDDANKPAGA